MYIHPGGWETALAVKHFLKTNSSGAVAPCTFYDEHYLKFSRWKFDDFEGRGIYRVLCCWRGGRCFPVLWASYFSKRLLRAWPVRLRKSVQFPWCHRRCQIPIPWSNWGFTAPSLRVLQEVGTAPLDNFHIPSMPPVCRSNVHLNVFWIWDTQYSHLRLKGCNRVWQRKQYHIYIYIIYIFIRMFQTR